MKFITGFILSLIVSTSSMASDVDKGSLFVVGSTSVAKLIDVTKDSFYEESGITIVVRPIGSDKGVVSIAEHVSDIGIISRFLTADEQKRWPQLSQISFAQDAIIFIVNTNNSITNLTRENIRDIYAGKQATWPNTENTIKPLAKAKAHGTHSSFLQLFAMESSKSIKGDSVNFKKSGIDQLFNPRTIDTFTHINQAVGAIYRTPHAIAFESLGAYSIFSINHPTKTKLIAINNQSPVKNSKVNPQYQFKRPLNIVTNIDHSKAAETYIQFLLSKQGQKILYDNFFIPLEQ